MSSDDFSALRQLSDADLDALITRLGRHALRRHSWRSSSVTEAAESAVCEAFKLWLDGTRHWNRDKYPDLESFLRGVVDSVLNHSLTSSYSRQTDLVGTGNEFVAPAGPGTSVHSPEDALLDRERQKEADFILDFASKNDSVAADTVKWMRAGCEKPQDIAGRIGCPVDEVYLAIRRLKSRGAAARKEWEARNSNIRGVKTYGDEAAK